MKEYTYRIECRPFSIGTYPEYGFLRHEKTGSKFGILIYDRLLTIEERTNYSLTPLSEVNELIGNTYSYLNGRAKMFIKNFDGFSLLVLNVNSQGVAREMNYSFERILSGLASGQFIKIA